MYGITPPQKKVIGDGCHNKGHTINHFKKKNPKFFRVHKEHKDN